MILEKILKRYESMYMREKVNWYYLENCILEDCKGNGTQTKYIISKIKEKREELQLSND